MMVHELPRRFRRRSAGRYSISRRFAAFFPRDSFASCSPRAALAQSLLVGKEKFGMHGNFLFLMFFSLAELLGKMERYTLGKV